MTSTNISDFLTPLIPCPRLELIYTIKFTQPLRLLFHDPLPLKCGYHIWKPPRGRSNNILAPAGPDLLAAAASSSRFYVPLFFRPTPSFRSICREASSSPPLPLFGRGNKKVVHTERSPSPQRREREKPKAKGISLQRENCMAARHKQGERDSSCDNNDGDDDPKSGGREEGDPSQTQQCERTRNKEIEEEKERQPALDAQMMLGRRENDVRIPLSPPVSRNGK